MLNLLAHAGQPPAPHDLWTSWNLDPLLIGLLAGLVWLRARGRARSPDARDPRRARAFALGIGTLALALVSPLEPLSGALASAHMVQHVLLMLVAAPLLASSAAGSTLLRGTPLGVRRLPGRLRRWLPASWPKLRLPRHPATVLLLYLGTLWFWHSSGAYGAALDHEAVHVAEHASFLLAALLFWRIVLSGRPGQRVPEGLGILLTFGAAMVSVLLAFLMTFATDPWYAQYATTTGAWGLGHLEDQQLAGAFMWVPAGAIHVGVALALFVSWMRDPPHAAEVTG